MLKRSGSLKITHVQLTFHLGIFLKQIVNLLIVILNTTIISAPFAFAGEKIVDDTEPRFLESAQKHLNHPCLRKKKFGIKFVSLDRGDTLLDIRSKQKFIPASNQKLITTASALRYLGPDFQFPTELYTVGKIKDAILEGDLYLKGFGDPKLVTEQMWLLANQLKNLPVKKVGGNIIIDDSYFDSERRIKSWRQKSGPQAYNAPLGALSFNFNTVQTFIQPAAKVGEKPIVIVVPDTDYIKVSNKAETVDNGRRNELIVNRLSRTGFNQVTISGKIRKTAPRAKYFLNITDPPVYAGTVFKDYLNQTGVIVNGQVLTGKVPNESNRIVQHHSEPLSLIIRGLNKFSNNFTAEQLVKTLAAHKYGEPGTSGNGIKVLSEYLESLGFLSNDFKMADGSGLSHENRLTPEQIVAVLVDVYREQSIFPEYIASLAIMGVDGSTVDRLANNPKASRARVKTGTLDGVSALSGYLQSRDGERFAFSMLMNDLHCNVNTVLRIQDKLVGKALNFQRRDEIMNYKNTNSAKKK